MIFSLVLAIILWAWADAEQGNLHEVVLNNVPVQVELTQYATDKGIKIVKGADATVTIVVRGTRANLRGIRAEDMRVVADTTGVYGSGVHKGKLSVTTSKKCEIVDVRGDNVDIDDIVGKYIKITCELFAEKKFVLTSEDIDISKLSLSDTEHMRFGKCEITDVSKVTVYGTHETLESIKKVCAVATSGNKLSSTDHIKAKLVAYDADGNVLEDVTFTEPANGEVGVVVPVITYREEVLAVSNPDNNVPDGLLDKLVVNPATIVLGELSEKKVLDTYLEKIRESLTVDFDHWLAEENKPLVQTVFSLKDKDDVEEVDGVYLDRVDQNQITITLDVEGYTNQNKKFSLLPGVNVTILCDEGYTAKINGNASIEVMLCGPKDVLDRMGDSDIEFFIDATGKSKETHTTSVRPAVKMDNVWVYYGTEESAVTYEIAYTIVKAEEPVAITE